MSNFNYLTLAKDISKEVGLPLNVVRPILDIFVEKMQDIVVNTDNTFVIPNFINLRRIKSKSIHVKGLKIYGKGSVDIDTVPKYKIVCRTSRKLREKLKKRFTDEN